MRSLTLPGAIIVASMGSLASGMVINAARIDHSPLVSDLFPLDLEERGLPVCGSIQNFVDVLKINKATAFCSSFLDIKTVSVPATQVIDTYVTATATVTETVTKTTTDATEIISFTESATVTAATTKTIFTHDIELTTVYITQAPYTVRRDATTYTTPLPAKRSVDAEKESVKLPPFVAGFASRAISKACFCLELPTPTVTVTSTSVRSNTIQTQITKTETDIKHETLTIRTTDTKALTHWSPTVTTTVTSTTSTVPIVAYLPRSTITTTVTTTLAFRPQCTGILEKPKLHKQIFLEGNRGIAWFAEGDLQVPDTSEYSHGICCESGYSSANVAYVSITRTGDQSWTCRRYFPISRLFGAPTTEQCPFGRGSRDQALGRHGTYADGISYIVGPCLGVDAPV
ncbi:hypothetical protein TWF730_005775 [Orbilia blumenaviensis]|uniref:Uncharacterized protein n=1 Tax=Orbilia blumenaviensis TaxID=1796055 RepID=A0AAV9VJD6_9PEZI